MTAGIHSRRQDDRYGYRDCRQGGAYEPECKMRDARFIGVGALRSPTGRGELVNIIKHIQWLDHFLPSDIKCTVIQYYNTNYGVKRFLILPCAPLPRGPRAGRASVRYPFTSRRVRLEARPCRARIADRLHYVVAIITLKNRKLEVWIEEGPRTLIPSVLNENIMRRELMPYETAA